MVFVGDLETVQIDEEDSEEIYNNEVKFIKYENLEWLKTDILNDLKKVNDSFKYFYPLLYNGTPKPNTYFNSNIDINNILGPHRLGFIKGVNLNENISKLNNLGYGNIYFACAGIFSNDNCVCAPKKKGTPDLFDPKDF